MIVGDVNDSDSRALMLMVILFMNTLSDDKRCLFCVVAARSTRPCRRHEVGLRWAR